MHGNPRYTDLVDENGKPRVLICTGLAHPSRRLFKCYWQIFHRTIGVEGQAFFNTPALCTHDAKKLMDFLDEKGEGYLVYTTSVPRQGNTPFDFSHSRWDGVMPAPAYEDDTDTEWEGHR